MARDHAQIRLDMWGDDDWRLLSVPAQHLYMLLLTSPSLSFCGVADWRPARIAPLAADWTVEEVCAAAEELSSRLFLVIDEDTEEVLIRSFVRHDGLMKMPNMATAMATAHAAVASALLRGVVVHELLRLHETQPDLPGWRSKKASELLKKGSVNPSGNPSVKGSLKGSVDPSVNPSPTPTPAPTPAPSSSNEEEKELTTLSGKPDEPSLFDEFWKLYPRKDAKIDARKAWKQVTKKAKPEAIIDAVTSYPFKSDRQFQPLPASWLRGQRWEDEAASGKIPMYDVSKLPEPGMGWSSEQLDMVLGKDTWVAPEPPAGMNEDDGYMWQQREVRKHRLERVKAACAAIGREFAA